MYKLRMALVGSSMVFAAATAQAAEISGNVTLASDYVWRGVSQTDESATVQGGFDVASDSGLYAGVWGSNVAFAGSLEADFYAGFANDISDDFNYDVGVIRYQYPNQPAGTGDINFNEVYFNVGYKSLSLGLAYSSDFAGAGKATYFSAGYDFSLPNEFGLGLHYGTQDIDAGGDYEDYSIGLTRELAGIEFGLTWYDTDISACNACESRVVLSMSKSL